MAEETGVNKEMEIIELNSENELEKTTDETTPQTEQIREKIEETRQEMSETIDAIQERLSISNISEQLTEQVSEQISNVYQAAKETVYDATLGKVGKIMNNMNQELQKSNLLNKAVENPFPLFLIALGAGLILFRNNKSSNHFSKKQKRHLTNGNKKPTQSGAINSLAETASSAYQTVTETADSAINSVSEAAGNTYHKIGDLGSSAQEKYELYLEEKPIVVGAVALAVGATIGMLLPITKYEEDLIGETSRNLLDKAQTKTQETVDSLKSVAQQAVETVRDEVKNYQNSEMKA